MGAAGDAPHEHLLNLIMYNLTLPQDVRRRLTRRRHILRHVREAADYHPSITVNRAMALDCMRDAIVVLRDMGVQDA